MTDTAFDGKFRIIKMQWEGENTLEDMVEAVAGTELLQFRFFMCLVVIFKKMGGVVSDPPIYLHTPIALMLVTNGIQSVRRALKHSFKSFDKLIENFEQSGSGWVFQRILELHTSVAKFNPLRSGSHIDTPNWIARKKAVVNVQNRDDLCVLYCMVGALFPPTNMRHRGSNPDIYMKNLDKIKTGNL